MCEFNQYNMERGQYSGFYNDQYVRNTKLQELSTCAPIFVMQRQGDGGHGSVVNEINLPLGLAWKNRAFDGTYMYKNHEVKPIPKYVEKFKTEICHFLDDCQECPYGDTCQYAHSLSELRPQKLHKKYKQTLCNKYVHGYCPYGRRCTYKHQAPEIKQYIIKKIDAKNTSELEFECVPFIPQEEEKNNSKEIKFERENFQVGQLPKKDQFESVFESVIQEVKSQSVFSYLRRGLLPEKEGGLNNLLNN
eukprot:TRINITY_DN1082_c1_g3_i2.p1 TRINITY_DN1082_c1_g3~~TRINITY_DN1082_c1_g3_i2.p1  ORF type:complete len:248 (+),score=28.66 TRINITY_DN1082_c1_g3_i2:341-1084(+)